MRASLAIDRSTTPLRRALLALGAALALLALAPRVAVADHDHAPNGPASHGCAACVVAHTPAELPPPVPALPAPSATSLEAIATTAQLAPTVQPWVLPFACGPPAVSSPLA